MLWVWNHLLKYVAGDMKNNSVQVIIELFLVFRCIIPVVFYLQINRGSFESKHKYHLLLSLFKLTTCFGPCTGPSSGHKIYN